MLQHGGTSKTYAQRNKPATKGQILYDPASVSLLEESNSEAESGMVITGTGGSGEGRVRV